MTFQWCTIPVKDFARSKTFYQDFLGMTLTAEFSPAPEMQIAFLAAENGVQIELLHNASAPVPAHPGSVSLGLAFPNYEEIFAKAQAAGSAPEPVTMPNGMVCFFLQDPDGVTLQIIKADTLQH